MRLCEAAKELMYCDTLIRRWAARVDVVGTPGLVRIQMRVNHHAIAERKEQTLEASRIVGFKSSTRELSVKCSQSACREPTLLDTTALTL